MNKRVFTLIACLATTLSLYGYDDSTEGFYAGGLGGANWQPEDKQDNNQLKFKTGYVVGLFAGYKFGNPFRLEGEVSYRHNDFKKVKVLGIRRPIEGRVESASFLANAIYDFEFTSSFTPYVGVGLGYTSETLTATFANIPELRIEGKDNGFSWQAIAGVSTPISCNTDLGVEYRYLNKKHEANHALALAVRRYF